MDIHEKLEEMRRLAKELTNSSILVREEITPGAHNPVAEKPKSHVHPYPARGMLSGPAFDAAQHAYHVALLQVEPFDHETEILVDQCEYSYCRNAAQRLVILPACEPVYKGDSWMPRWQAYLCLSHTEREKFLATRYGYKAPEIYDFRG